jgi:hypothetical protein
MTWLSTSIIIIVITFTYFIFQKSRRKAQLAFIKSYPFHKSIRDKINKTYSHLTIEQSHLVFRALRDYFWMCNMSKRKMVAMPLQVVDDAWHEFILFTRSYQTFCQKALGRFLHHTPDRSNEYANAGTGRY